MCTWNILWRSQHTMRPRTMTMFQYHMHRHARLSLSINVNSFHVNAFVFGAEIVSYVKFKRSFSHENEQTCVNINNLYMAANFMFAVAILRRHWEREREKRSTEAEAKKNDSGWHVWVLWLETHHQEKLGQFSIFQA